MQPTKYKRNQKGKNLRISSGIPNLTAYMWHKMSFGPLQSQFKGTSRGLEALQSHMNDAYYKSVLCLHISITDGLKGTTPIIDHRDKIVQAHYVKGTRGL